MADIVDRANDVAEQHRADALAAHAARVQEAMRPRDPATGTACLDYPGEIEPQRLRILPRTNRCARCAQIAEDLYRSKAWMP